MEAGVKVEEYDTESIWELKQVNSRVSKTIWKTLAVGFAEGERGGIMSMLMEAVLGTEKARRRGGVS